VCQVVILKVISFDCVLDVARAVDGRFLSQQRPGMDIRPYRVTFVLMVTGFTVSRIIFRCSCVVCGIGVGRNISMNKRYICKYIVIRLSCMFWPSVSWSGTRGTRWERLVEALYYKPEGRGFDSRLCHNPSGRTVAVGSTQPLTGYRLPVRAADIFTIFMCRLS
jgi:hypothetical protein